MAWHNNKAWRGEERLWIVFWIYGFIPWTAAVFLFFSVGEKVRSPLMTADLNSFVSQGLYTALMIFRIMYVPWISISVWKCARNTTIAAFGYAARTVVVILFAGTVIGLFVPFKGYTIFLNGVYNDPMVGDPPHVAQCKIKMKEVALQNNVDPKHYIDENQAYLQKCVRYLDATATNTP